MGCRISSHESDSSPPDTMFRAANQTDQINYKARIEKKLCLARETPESVFDITQCNLKEIPPGVFVLCKVLRKEQLLLSENKLTSLVCSGGSLGDLSLLTTLDLRSNRFRKLPDEIYKLENLRELVVSQNQLTTLPPILNRLRKLELLDVSENCLQSIEQVSCMLQLRILNVSGNPQLKIISPQLATCESLVDLILDDKVVENPPQEVTIRGTLAILQFLATGLPPEGDFTAPDGPVEEAIAATEEFLAAERGAGWRGNEMEEKQRVERFMQLEREALERNQEIEAKLHMEQQRKREELLKELLKEQTESDQKVAQLQQEKEVDRNRLITDILREEERWSGVLDKLISLRSAPDPILLEQERIEQERLLEQLKIHQSDLRKQEILAAMTDLLANEVNRVTSYQEKRDEASRDVLAKECETNDTLEQIFRNHSNDRREIVTEINRDEELQKAAVATLISKNDARSWGLVEQMRIVEGQLAAMSNFEMEKKKMATEEQIQDLAEKRLNLTLILVDLLGQQEQRRQQLLDTLAYMENTRNDRQDFWLLHYQRLLDAQPEELEFQSVDPLLGYNFLVNGVVHCLPFLSRLWQSKGKAIEDITEEDLIEAGVKKEKDRAGIIKSIRDFIASSRPESNAGFGKSSAPQESPEESPEKAAEATASAAASEFQETAAECVICMDEKVGIIFIPCGHLCVCLECHQSVATCPMCRAAIDQRIRVIQP
ncbi:E3 ubiquitin-protein ligase LRSAM1-like isoform X2 [Lutzomyia longipalpis]|uniref:E3 ubiquitin-protein ligase LRSAM1-like isoform X2 n=1 Tax=Lutzomyia longipalpis TaxID=7200 RepID=UPI002483664E|nr:E3 ubiquitin-protein ligase LRSAM1-like isoform X2 [Lutzomyia longipalpis]